MNGSGLTVKSKRKKYIIKLYREDGDIESFTISAPDDATAMDSAEVGFNRIFQFSGIDEETGYKIIEERLNE